MGNRLPEKFTQHRFRYSQLERNHNYVIYLKENDVPIDSKDYYFCYEVVRIKKQKASSYLIEGKTIIYSVKEIYPGDKDWGIAGWTFRDGTKAREYFKNCIVGASFTENPYNTNNTPTLAEKVPPCAECMVKTEDSEQLSMWK